MRKKLKRLEAVKMAGNDAFSRGRFAEAIALYSEALAVDPENHDVNTTLFSNRATAHFKLRNYTSSIDDCNTALSSHPRHMKALLRRASCKIAQEDWKGAISDYEAAVSIEPDDESIRSQLRNANLELRKSQRKDLYAVLATNRKATNHEIKKARSAIEPCAVWPVDLCRSAPLVLRRPCRRTRRWHCSFTPTATKGRRRTRKLLWK